ncbi:hypothetical protein VNO77_08225 [Canavalia gladiata]|uniref:Secreted protein n=1 Tax=Canavalia gladiata TaxID=3824 RepID=A0AAN9QWZ4_CANGL
MHPVGIRSGFSPPWAAAKPFLVVCLLPTSFSGFHSQQQASVDSNKAGEGTSGSREQLARVGEVTNPRPTLPDSGSSRRTILPPVSAATLICRSKIFGSWQTLKARHLKSSPRVPCLSQWFPDRLILLSGSHEEVEHRSHRMTMVYPPCS